MLAYLTYLIYLLPYLDLSLEYLTQFTTVVKYFRIYQTDIPYNIRDIIFHLNVNN